MSKGFQSLKATGGDPWDWQQEKKITFKADIDEKGELQIEGEDTNDDDNCTWGGLLLHCSASDVNSPWHNFKSDKGHWRTGDYKQPCSVHGKGMIPVAMPFMKTMLAKGSMKIWSNKQKVTLVGSPFLRFDETKKCFFFGLICGTIETPIIDHST